MSGTKSFSPDQVQLFAGTPPDDLIGTMEVLMKTNKYYTDGSLLQAKISYTVTREWGRAAVEAGWAEDTGDVLPVQDNPGFGEGVVSTLSDLATSQLSEVTPYVNATASAGATVFSGACELAGWYCSVAAGTITIYDALSATGTPIVPATALVVGPMPIFGAGTNGKLALTTGCHVVLSGAATVRVLVA